ncbi:MAG: shikimate kinase, partial [Desulfobacterales bacterium]
KPDWIKKSTIGVLLARWLGYSFLDTDLILQSAERKTLQQLIQIHGTSGFCDLEEYTRPVNPVETASIFLS